VADAPVFSAVERLHEQLAAVRSLLTDPERTAIRVVLTPEQVVVAEARRTVTYLALFDFAVDAVIVNRMLPDVITDPWFDRWKQLHVDQLAEIVSVFDPLPVLTSELMDREPIGLELLANHGAELWGGSDPTRRLHTGKLLEVTERGDQFVLSVPLPMATKSDVRLVRRGDELLVTIGSYRRSILIPDALARRRVTDAVVRNGALEVEFARR
jgi:arsenite-transporting ATPase